jgi:hypothetical protein
MLPLFRQNLPGCAFNKMTPREKGNNEIEDLSDQIEDRRDWGGDGRENDDSSNSTECGNHEREDRGDYCRSEID